MPALAAPITRRSDDPEIRFRVLCSERLADVMAANGVSRKELVRRLAEGGHDVTTQAVSHWLNGNRLPRSTMQAAIARALDVRPRTIYDIEAAL